MSHFVKLKVSATDKEILSKALDRMGVRHKAGKNEEIIVGRGLIMSKSEDGSYTINGDFYNEQGRLSDFYNREKKFQEELTTAYTISQTETVLEEQGFTIDENIEGRIGSDGLIRMSAFRAYA